MESDTCRRCCPDGGPGDLSESESRLEGCSHHCRVFCVGSRDAEANVYMHVGALFVRTYLRVTRPFVSVIWSPWMVKSVIRPSLSNTHTQQAMTDKFEIDLNLKPGEDLQDEDMGGNAGLCLLDSMYILRTVWTNNQNQRTTNPCIDSILTWTRLHFLYPRSHGALGN